MLFFTSLAGYRGIEAGVESVEVLAVQIILDGAQRFSETVECKRRKIVVFMGITPEMDDKLTIIYIKNTHIATKKGLGLSIGSIFCIFEFLRQNLLRSYIVLERSFFGTQNVVYRQEKFNQGEVKKYLIKQGVLWRLKQKLRKGGTRNSRSRLMLINGIILDFVKK